MSTVNPYPVDSATRACCGGIGGHTRECRVAVLDDVTKRIDGIRCDVNAVIRDLPENTSMWVIVDIVNALWNLRNASLLLDKANDALEADAKAGVR